MKVSWSKEMEKSIVNPYLSDLVGRWSLPLLQVSILEVALQAGGKVRIKIRDSHS